MLHRDLTTRVVVIIKDGLVSDICRPRGVTVEIIGLDTDGAEQENLCGCSMADDPHWHSGYGDNSFWTGEEWVNWSDVPVRHKKIEPIEQAEKIVPGDKKMAKVKPCEKCGSRKEYIGIDGLLDRYYRSDYPVESRRPGELRYPLVRICGRCWGIDTSEQAGKKEASMKTIVLTHIDNVPSDQICLRAHVKNMPSHSMKECHCLQGITSLEEQCSVCQHPWGNFSYSVHEGCAYLMADGSRQYAHCEIIGFDEETNHEVRIVRG